MASLEYLEHLTQGYKIYFIYSFIHLIQYDFRELEERYAVNDKDASLAIEMFCYGVAKTIASYVVPLGG